MRILTSSLICACAFIAQAQTFTLDSVKEYGCVLSSQSKVVVSDYPVVINIRGEASKSRFVVLDSKKRVIPSQMDDLDGDGLYDELVFLADFSGKKCSYSIRPASDSDKLDYTPRVHAQMFHKNSDKSIEPTLIASSQTGDLYNQLHHHGPAFESELIAYRLYFDRKQTVDVYGKTNKQLELNESLWYPTDEQLERGFGDDILRVSGSVGVGTLKGWDEKKKRAIHIEPVTNRTATVLSKGPLRTIVDMSVEGWSYMGQTVSLNSRYTLYAGDRVVKVSHKVESQDPSKLVFTTGVQKIGESQTYSDHRGVNAVWGRDWPVNDTIKYAKQSVGLAVSIPSEFLHSEVEDRSNYLYKLIPNSDGELNYYFAAVSLKESWISLSSDKFFTLVKSNLFKRNDILEIKLFSK
ncbi:MAG: DUF4861 family protein [Bacteroidales bacterium]